MFLFGPGAPNIWRDFELNVKQKQKGVWFLFDDRIKYSRTWIIDLIKQNKKTKSGFPRQMTITTCIN